MSNGNGNGPGPPPDKDPIRLNFLDIVKARLGKKSDVRIPFLQKAGVWLFYSVLLVMSLVLGALFWYLFSKTPAFPELTAGTSSFPDSLSAVSLASQRTEVFGNFIMGVEKILVAVFLPVLTAILGYLFGTRGTGE